MNPYALAGAFLCAVAAACCIPSWLTRLDQWRADRRLVKARMTRIDALIESALLDGETTRSATPIFDALVNDPCAAAIADVDNEWRGLA